MKVTPSNQTLILASERGVRGGDARRATSEAQSGSSPAAVLQRVTVMTALPDSTLVYLRADYAPQAERVPATVTVASQQSFGTSLARPLTVSKDAYGNPQSRVDGARVLPLRPEERYAQTQRILATPPSAAQLDVHA